MIAAFLEDERVIACCLNTSPCRTYTSQYVKQNLPRGIAGPVLSGDCDILSHYQESCKDVNVFTALCMEDSTFGSRSSNFIHVQVKYEYHYSKNISFSDQNCQTIFSICTSSSG